MKRGFKFSFGAEFKREFGLLPFINQKSVESTKFAFKGQKMKKLVGNFKDFKVDKADCFN